MKFSDNLKSLRKKNKISQEQLAERINVSRQSISKWETGEAYPEMNNMLELCKIFNCHINDLVHEDMSDIDSLDKEIMKEVVKLNKSSQKKVKGLSKTIGIASTIANIVITVGLVFTSIVGVILPFMINSLELRGNEIYAFGHVVGKLNPLTEVPILNNLLSNYSTTGQILLIEVIIICIVVSLILMLMIVKKLNKLADNIYEGNTPFTYENVKLMKSIANYMLASTIFPVLSGSIFEFSLGSSMNMELSATDIVYVLVVYTLAYIFEYGVSIQKDSKGVMYDKKK